MVIRRNVLRDSQDDIEIKNSQEGVQINVKISIDLPREKPFSQPYAKRQRIDELSEEDSFGSDDELSEEEDSEYDRDDSFLSEHDDEEDSDADEQDSESDDDQDENEPLKPAKSIDRLAAMISALENGMTNEKLLRCDYVYSLMILLNWLRICGQETKNSLYFRQDLEDMIMGKLSVPLLQGIGFSYTDRCGACHLPRVLTWKLYKDGKVYHIGDECAHKLKAMATFCTRLCQLVTACRTKGDVESAGEALERAVDKAKQVQRDTFNRYNRKPVQDTFHRYYRKPVKI